MKGLMANRKNDKNSRHQLAMTINMIDVVFHEDKDVLNSYHLYRDALLSGQNSAFLILSF